MDQDIIRKVFEESKTIAVVGLSPDPTRASHGVASYLQAQGYRIIPINPLVEEVLGEKSYPDLASVPEELDVVDVFRRAQYVPAIVEAAIAKGARVIWMQEGIIHQEAAERAREAGLIVVMDRCMLKDHRGLV